MNVEVEFKNNKWIVTDQFGNETERELVPNIKEILTTENNIEEIENLITKNQKTIDRCESEIESKNPHMRLCLLWGLISISRMISKLWTSAIFCFLCSCGWGSLAYFNKIRPNKKKINLAKKSIKFLEEQLTLENEKLKELSNEKTSNSNYIDTSSKLLNSNSDKIIELQNKLMIIEDYQHNKQKYISNYKKGILKGLTIPYLSNNLAFLEELIKNDLAKENNKNEKQKVLKK